MDVQKIAIDIGSGDVKWFYVDEDGKERYGKFPTAVAPAREASTSFSVSEKGNSGTLRYNGENMFVGESAVQSAIPTCSVDFQQTYNGLLTYKAFLEAGLDLSKPIKVNTGVTLRYWDKRKEIVGGMKNIIVNDKQINSKLGSIFAQGQGAYINEGSPAGSIVIIDGGLNTLDVIVFQDGQPIAEHCYANNDGAIEMIRDIKNYIRKNYGTSVSDQQAKKFFDNKSFTVFGEKHDLSDIVRKLQKGYIDKLFMSLKSENGDILSYADAVIFTGGLGYFLEGVDLSGNIHLSSKPYEYCNVRGYYYG